MSMSIEKKTESVQSPTFVHAEHQDDKPTTRDVDELGFASGSGNGRVKDMPSDNDVVLRTILSAEAGVGCRCAECVAQEEEVADRLSPGRKGWINLAGAVTVNAICYGMTNSFGVFQSYYTTDLIPQTSSTSISWIGSLQLCLCPLLGCISGPLFDAGYLRPLIGFGGALYVFCLMMTSLGHAYWHFLLAHGIGVGLGMGLMFSPSVATISHHFGKTRYRTLAFGCQAAGSSLGGIVFPIMLRFLFPKVGFGWAVRIMAFVVLCVVIFAFFTLSSIHVPRKKLAILSPTVFRDKGYDLYVLGVGLISLTIYCPLTFGVTYARSRGMAAGLASYSLAIANGCSIVGRILPLIVAQKFGPLNVLTLFAALSAVMLFSWTTARTIPAVLVYDAFYGITCGAYAAAVNPSAASFAKEPDQVGLYLGMAFFTTSFFWLAGTPITAALIGSKDNYLPGSMFCGAVVILGAVSCAFARWLASRDRGTNWV
ncbi:major facilitator superfamily domain-containing protein [Naematelia encephala]|uniref:Major facilitator superfamily domain-containing protein n=1 Tax=Naematelia encephala TaxID=71784 RepID=A0A1Y2B7I3_9TREE|nr:major facilitator superfamily domain-containing protein [Naematelia encephala]